MVAMLRFRKPLLALVALAGVLTLACQGGGDDPVEYLAQPDAVLIQMLNVSGEPQPEIAGRLASPDFTLYGDGTRIFMRPDDDGRSRLMRAQLPGEAIVDLLQFINDEGFLNFSYAQPVPDQVDDAPTTYLYVNTNSGTNSTRALALDDAQLENAGDEFDPFRRLQAIKQRLDELDPEALGGRLLGPYEPEEIALLVQPLVLSDPTEETPVWAVDGFDLDSTAPPGAGVVHTTFAVAEAAELIETLPEGSFARFRQGDRLFAVGYRPVLPFEEDRFPEFDFP